MMMNDEMEEKATPQIPQITTKIAERKTDINQYITKKPSIKSQQKPPVLNDNIPNNEAQPKTKQKQKLIGYKSQGKAVPDEMNLAKPTKPAKPTTPTKPTKPAKQNKRKGGGTKSIKPQEEVQEEKHHENNQQLKQQEKVHQQQVV